MPIIRKNLTEDCAILPNDLLQDISLSYAAKGLLCDLLSRPPHLKICKSDFVHANTSYYEVNKLFQELKACGYLVLVDRKINGRMVERVWVVSATPITQKQAEKFLENNQQNFKISSELIDNFDEIPTHRIAKKRTSGTEVELQAPAPQTATACQHCLFALNQAQHPISEINIKFAINTTPLPQKEKEETKETKQEEKKKVIQRKKEEQKKEKKEEKEKHLHMQTPGTETILAVGRSPPVGYRAQSQISDFLAGFAEFKALYPRKQGWMLAQKKWLAKKCYLNHEKILADIKLRLQTEWANIEKQFIPLPASYLVHERWTDEEVVTNKDEKPNKFDQYIW